MYSLRDAFERIKNSCRTKKPKCADIPLDPARDIFEQDWEVYVVKYDMSAGKFVGKTACCALSPV